MARFQRIGMQNGKLFDGPRLFEKRFNALGTRLRVRTRSIVVTTPS